MPCRQDAHGAMIYRICTRRCQHTTAPALETTPQCTKTYVACACAVPPPTALPKHPCKRGAGAGGWEVARASRPSQRADARAYSPRPVQEGRHEQALIPNLLPRLRSMPSSPPNRHSATNRHPAAQKQSERPAWERTGTRATQGPVPVAPAASRGTAGAPGVEGAPDLRGGLRAHDQSTPMWLSACCHRVIAMRVDRTPRSSSHGSGFAMCSPQRNPHRK